MCSSLGRPFVHAVLWYFYMRLCKQSSKRKDVEVLPTAGPLNYTELGTFWEEDRKESTNVLRKPKIHKLPQKISANINSDDVQNINHLLMSVRLYGVWWFCNGYFCH